MNESPRRTPANSSTPHNLILSRASCSRSWRTGPTSSPTGERSLGVHLRSRPPTGGVPTSSGRIKSFFSNAPRRLRCLIYCWYSSVRRCDFFQSAVGCKFMKQTVSTISLSTEHSLPSPGTSKDKHGLLRELPDCSQNKRPPPTSPPATPRSRRSYLH